MEDDSNTSLRPPHARCTQVPVHACTSHHTYIQTKKEKLSSMSNFNQEPQGGKRAAFALLFLPTSHVVY